jgi:hypothetical protein
MTQENKKTKEERKIEEAERKKRLKEKAKEATLKFQREFRKSVVTSIVSAFGLLIALTWKDVITAWVNKISQASPIKGNLITAIIVTAICVLGILIISKWGNEEKKND